ncbi:tetratricopeptide repeat (TPR)-like superfamily protein [Actinidia rufa]|uniref:Tetratricopeptide repeat (TPR)-like superfamily protein n=1 Tax=Actinidia rufa TaxID=165716 RepID=A0A7J0H6C9_9ERIC|nr:tetratricopeptide repeat (TPR)-like superfamily protein [Actinidia rufa]
MSTSLSLRHARHLSASANTTASAASSTISVSKAKYKLRSEFDPDKALEIYSSVSGHYTSPLSSRYALDLTVKRLAKSRRFADIETLLDSHKNNPKNHPRALPLHPHTILRLAHMFDNALNTCNQMDDLKNSEIGDLLQRTPLRLSYCGVDSPELAIATMREMEEKVVEITAVTYTTVMSALYKKGKSNEAEGIWNEMVRKACSPDVAAYNVRLMQAQGEDPENVKGLIEEMVNTGLKPDAISYNYWMTCYCKHGMMDKAMMGYKVFKKSVEVNRIPDFNTLKHLMEGLVKTSKMKAAKGMSQTLKKKFPASFLNAWTKLEDELGFVAAPSSGDSETQ